MWHLNTSEDNDIFSIAKICNSTEKSRQKNLIMGNILHADLQKFNVFLNNLIYSNNNTPKHLN